MAAEWVRAPGAGAETGKALLYLHGGGYALCGLGTHRLLAYNLSRAAGMPCLLLDYRLATEHPYPAAIEDAAAGYDWLLAQGYRADRLAVAGDSAGGGLTLAAMARLRQRGRPLPGALACLSPWTDMTMTGASIEGLAAADPLVRPRQPGTLRAMVSGRWRPARSARLSAVWRSGRPAAAADPGRRRGDFAR
ncbi:MAG: alpha/beta hydrolase fold domain-containing protein [Alphaproteobacteria bacterium]